MTSKIAHSCSPNAIHSSNKPVVVVQAMKPISTGEMITITYLPSSTLAYSTPHRRKTLLNNYCFHCMCERCISPDVGREIKCQKSCGGGMLRSEVGLWECSRCKCTLSDTDMPLTTEKMLEEAYFYWSKYAGDLYNHKVIYVNLHKLEKSSQKANEILGVNHWVSARMSYMLFELKRAVNPQSALASSFHWILWVSGYMVDIYPASVLPVLPCVRLCIQYSYKISELKLMFPKFIHILHARYGQQDEDAELMKRIIDTCGFCKTQPANKTCGRCLQERYCCQDCQRSDWHRHKLSCKAPK